MATAIPIVGPTHLADCVCCTVHKCVMVQVPVVGPSLHRPNTGRTYFEEKKEDLLHKYSQVNTETAGEEVTATSLCTYVSSCIRVLTLCNVCYHHRGVHEKGSTAVWR